MTFNKTAILILSLSLTPINPLFTTQDKQAQELTTAPHKKDQKPWYKKTTNWLLITGAALGAVLTGAVMKQEWEKRTFQVKQARIDSLIRDIPNQRSMKDLEALKSKNADLFSDDQRTSLRLNLAYVVKETELMLNESKLKEDELRLLTESFLVENVIMKYEPRMVARIFNMFKEIKNPILQDVLNQDSIKNALKEKLAVT